MPSDTDDSDDFDPDPFYPGATFPSKAAFKVAIAHEAARTTRSCLFSKNDSEKITARCKDLECDYIVRGRVQPGVGVRVSSCFVMHSCPLGMGASTSGLIVEDVCRDVLRYDENAKPADIIAKARVDFGYSVTYSQAYRALDRVRLKSKTANAKSYGLIKQWLQGLHAANEGTVVDFQSGPAQNATKVFLMLGSWARSFDDCLPVLCFDACHLKCKEGGTMFLATALSPNRDIVVIAAGIGIIEDGEHWAWFLRNIQKGIDLERRADVVLMSDREKGLDTAMRLVYPTLPHGYCSVHIKKNVISNHRTDFNGRINSIAKCLATSTYAMLVQECASIEKDKDALVYLQAIDKKSWITCFFPRARFGQVTTNMAESINSWILDERDMSWFSCLDGVVRRVQKRSALKREEYASLHQQSVAWVEAKVMKMTSLARKRLVVPVTTEVFEVKRESSRTYAIVNIAERSCSCGFWAEFKYPCVHACAAILCRRKSPIDFISDYYSTKKLQAVFEGFAVPVDIVDISPDSTAPPDINKRRGRPKKIRIRNRSEYVNDDSPIRCSECGVLGHNKRTCKRRAAAHKSK